MLSIRSVHLNFRTKVTGLLISATLTLVVYLDEIISKIVDPFELVMLRYKFAFLQLQPVSTFNLVSYKESSIFSFVICIRQTTIFHIPNELTKHCLTVKNDCLSNSMVCMTYTITRHCSFTLCHLYFTHTLGFSRVKHHFTANHPLFHPKIVIGVMLIKLQNNFLFETIFCACV